jgi:hypothetical protein
LVENFAQGLCGEENIVDSIPCVISADQTKFMVLLNEFDSKKFSKSTLLNLVGTAESVSPACQQIIFIVSRAEKIFDNYKSFKKMFEVIEASRMTKSEIGPLVNQQEPNELAQILEQYGFYKLNI